MPYPIRPLLLLAPLALILPGLAGECTPSGWCVVEAENGYKSLYLVIQRTDRYAYLLEQDIGRDGSRKPDPGRFFQVILDCKKWTRQIKLGESVSDVTIIVPGSIGDAKARDVCNRPLQPSKEITVED